MNLHAAGTRLRRQGAGALAGRRPAAGDRHPGAWTFVEFHALSTSAVALTLLAGTLVPLLPHDRRCACRPPPTARIAAGGTGAAAVDPGVGVAALQAAITGLPLGPVSILCALSLISLSSGRSRPPPAPRAGSSPGEVDLDQLSRSAFMLIASNGRCHRVP